MMFLIRSAFWLGIVFSAMPFDRAEIAGDAVQVKNAVAASALAAAKTRCAQDVTACGAALNALGGGAPSTNIERLEPQRATTPRAAAKEKALQSSANSLNAADLAPPWRGRPRKSGA